MAGEGGMTVVLRTLRSRLIPPEKFGSTLSATILILLLPFPVAGVLTAFTPPDALGHVITVCAALQALGLFCTFARLRTDPVLRTWSLERLARLSPTRSHSVSVLSSRMCTESLSLTT
jgi:hypothetical protein